MIQIGAAFGSTVGRNHPDAGPAAGHPHRGGAGGGIAATFNTPIGGIAFAMELMLPFVSPMSLLCVAVSCVTATLIGQHFFGVLPAFDVPALAAVEGAGLPVSVYPSFVLFALLMGVMAWIVTRANYWFEDLFDAMPGNYYTRHIFGMVLVGTIFYGFMMLASPWFGQPNHYYVQGSAMPRSWTSSASRRVGDRLSGPACGGQVAGHLSRLWAPARREASSRRACSSGRPSGAEVGGRSSATSFRAFPVTLGPLRLWPAWRP